MVGGGKRLIQIQRGDGGGAARKCYAPGLVDNIYTMMEWGEGWGLEA